MSQPIQLSSNQQDIWHDQHAYPKSPLYNIGGTFIFNGSIDYRILNKAIQHLIEENDTFRLSISKQTPATQKLLKKLVFELEFIDFSSHHSPKDKAKSWLEYKFKQPFSLNENDLLWHFALVKESEQRYYLMTKYHHVIADGWSTTVVISRLAEIYNALLNNHAIEKKSSQRYFDFIDQEFEYLNSAAFHSDDEYWKKTLPTAPQPLISRRYPASSKSLLPKAHLHRFTIKRDFYNKINKFSSHYKSTSYHALLTSLAIYFSRINQRKDIVIGVPSLNRGGARYKDVFGMFISLSPLILNISQTENIINNISHCRTQLRELYRHQRFPLGNISSRLKLLQSSQDTLFDIVLSYEKHDYSSTYGNTGIIAKQQFSGVARYPLAVTICEFSSNDDVEIIFEGAENCFIPEDLHFLANRMLLILQQMIEQPEKNINEFDILSRQDHNIIFDQFNTGHNQGEVFSSVIQQFQKHVSEQPTHIAVEFENKKLSYKQLDQYSTQLAQHLLNQGTKANDIIALCLPRSLEMVIGILAILKTSAAYLPIPTDIPKERIKNILQQSQSHILLTHSSYQLQLFRIEIKIINIDDYELQQKQSVQQIQNIELMPKDLAYVIFTSGSNGQPKGVMIEHGSLFLRINWLQTLFKLTPQDRMGQTIQYYFDPSLIEIFLSLTQGANLVLVPENNFTANNFAQFFIDHKISSVALVPSSLRLLLQGLRVTSERTKLRVTCCGGERLEPSLTQQFSQLTDAILFNVYGPTETTIIATYWECQINEHSRESLPIGKPADNTGVYITDQQLNILPTNVIGEIIITGDTVARGYLQQPLLTKNAFHVWPYNQSQLYKTGDLGYIGYNGLLYFSGRVDRQVKISGYRIELGEIESVLLSHNSVTNAAVITLNTDQHKNLCAYVETKEKDTISLLNELSLLLRQRLPHYMQPRVIIPLGSIKTNQTGKVDYSALPKADINNHTSKNNLPRNILEVQLLQLWTKTLSIKQIGIYDNFFELGGDSLSAISLMIAIEKMTGLRYPLSFLLEKPNIAEQASALEKSNALINPLLLIPLSDNKNTPPLYIAASGYGDTLRFSNLADSLGNFFNVLMLQPPAEETLKNNKKLSIPTIAQCYADKIMQHSNTPYYLSGFSIGGITILETARILTKKGRPPRAVIMLDTIYPRWPLQSPFLFKFIQYTVKQLHLNRKVINNRRLGAMLSDPGINAQLSALHEHKIQGVKVPVELILTRGMWMFQPLLFSSWSRILKNHLTRHSISGMHGGIFQKPHLQELTNLIKKIHDTYDQ